MPAGRIFRWINNDVVACPPYGCVLVNDAAMDGDDVIFYGGRNLADIPPISNLGVPWNMGFNAEMTVEPTKEGRITFDLPAWGLIEGSANLSDFVTYFPDVQHWSLGLIPTDQQYIDLGIDPESHLWAGFRVIATQTIPAFVVPWQLKQPSFLQGNFKIGLLGGLVTYLDGTGAGLP